MSTRYLDAVYPPEFFQPHELANLLDAQTAAAQIAVLEAAGVKFIKSRRGRPLVYRDQLIPSAGSAHNAPPTFDYAAARAPRPTAKRRQP